MNEETWCHKVLLIYNMCYQKVDISAIGAKIKEEKLNNLNTKHNTRYSCVYSLRWAKVTLQKMEL